MRRVHFVLLFLVLVIGAQPLVAVTYYVTHQPTLLCTNNKTGYSIFLTIQDAVTQVPAGSTINVCPGTYAEQVIISQPLTLRGVSYGASSQAVIAMPSTGLTTTSSASFGTVAPQVQVTAGPVKISNITVDGTAGSSNCPAGTYFGIFYSSGSSGTVSEVEARNQNCSAAGIGIGAENGPGATGSIIIENNTTNAANGAGIAAGSEGSPSTLTVSIKGNYVTGSFNGIVTCCNVAGTVSDNVINAVAEGSGVFALSPSTAVSGNTIIGPVNGLGIYVDVDGVTVSDNTIHGAEWGVWVYGAATVTSNHVFNSSAGGIYIDKTGATVKSNVITGGPVGIGFNCFTGTVSGNTINGVTTGLDGVPASFTGVNTFYNLATNTTSGGC